MCGIKTDSRRENDLIPGDFFHGPKQLLYLISTMLSAAVVETNIISFHVSRYYKIIK